MTTITHDGKTAKINASIGIITKSQAARLIRLLGGLEYSDGHQVYCDIHGFGNCWKLRKFAHLTTA